MSQPTEHGDNIAEQIQIEDCYGGTGQLTLADVWNIVDNLHSHFMEYTPPDGPNVVLDMFSGWMRQLEKMDTELPPL